MFFLNQIFTLELCYARGFRLWAFASAEVLVQWFRGEQNVFTTSKDWLQPIFFLIIEVHCIYNSKMFGHKHAVPLRPICNREKHFKKSWPEDYSTKQGLTIYCLGISPLLWVDQGLKTGIGLIKLINDHNNSIQLAHLCKFSDFVISTLTCTENPLSTQRNKDWM